MALAATAMYLGNERSELNEAAQGSIDAYATDTRLDAAASKYGLTRLDEETDDELWERMRNVFDTPFLGLGFGAQADSDLDGRRHPGHRVRAVRRERLERVPGK